MSLVWLEGFETDTSTTGFSRKYSGGLTEDVPDSLQPGRFGGKCIRAANNNLWTLGTDSTGQRNSLVTGMAVRGDDVYHGMVIAHFAGHLGLPALQIKQLRGTGDTIQYAFINKSTTLYTTPEMDPGVWVYLEAWMRFELPSTAINTIFRVNGMATYVARIENGINPVLLGYGNFYIGGRAEVGGYADMDDFYVFDHTQDGPYFFPWDSPQCAVQTLYPKTAGSNTEWTVSGAPSNTNAVDDSISQGVNDDSDYNIGDSSTDLDLHRMDEPSYVNDEIYGVEFEWDARADDGEGTADIQFLYQSSLRNPTEAHSQAAIILPDSTFVRVRFRHYTSPITGSFFSPEELREFQLGYGAKENFTSLIVEDDGDPPVEELALDYGSASNPTGTPLDYGSADNPTGPGVDLGNA